MGTLAESSDLSDDTETVATLQRQIAELSEAERRFRTMAETVPVMIWQSDASKAGIYFNRAWLAFTGCTLEEELGAGWLARVHPEDLPRLNECTRAFAARQPFTTEFRLRRHDGEYRWVLDTAMPRFDPEGGFLGFVGSCTDITERKLAEQLLERREAEARALIEQSPLPMIVYAPTGQPTAVNPAWERFWGLTIADAPPGYTVLDDPQLEAQGCLPLVRRAFAGEAVTLPAVYYDIGRTIGDPRGPAVWVQGHFYPIRDPDRSLVAVVLTQVDLTEQKRVEAALAEEGRRNRDLARMLDLTQALVCDPEDRITFWSAGAARLYGWSPEEAVGRLADELLRTEFPTSREQITASLLRDGQWQGELVHVGKDGRRVHVASHWTLRRGEEGRPLARVEVNNDITQAKLAEERLRESEARFAAAFANAAAGLSIATLDGRIVQANRTHCELLGYSGDELMRLRLLDITHPDDVPESRRLLERLIAGEIQSFVLEERMLRKSGEIVWVRNSVSLIRGGADRPGSLVAITEDVTARKRAEEALRASEARFRSVFESGMIGIAFWDGEKVTGANDAFLTLLGYDSADLEAGLIRSGRLTPAEHAAADRRATAEVLASGTCTPYEKEFFRKDGTRVPVLVGGALLGRDRRNGVFFVLDLSERRRVEEQLQAAQRLDMVGRLAGGMAHEANNQMAVILGTTEFVLRRRDLPVALREDIDQIRRAAERTSAVTKQLLAFSRRQVLQPQVLDYNAEIQSLEAVLRRALGPQSRLSLELSPLLGRVRVDPGQLAQVLLNLTLNARDAMPEGGTLTIATRGVELTAADAARHPGELIRPGPYVRLAVRDTGHGMDAATLGRIFEPFFTTKPVGQGTGLGLSSVHGIVRQSGGYIWASSAPGAGATFEIYLPIAEAPAGVPAAERPSPATPGSGTVLIVEDETALRGIMTRTLLEEGYLVLEADDGREALSLLARHPEAPVLVIADLVMPGMSGRALATMLAQERPGIPVLFTSGFADNEMIQRGLLASGEPFLQKPFTPDMLARAVHELLHGR